MGLLKRIIGFARVYRDILLSIVIISVTFITVILSWGLTEAGGCGEGFDETENSDTDKGREEGDQFILAEDETSKELRYKKPKISTQTQTPICGISASATAQSKTFEWNMDNACPSGSFQITLTNSCDKDVTATISKPDFLNVTTSGNDIGANIILKKKGQQGSIKTLNVLPNCGSVTAIGSLTGDVVITAQNSAIYSFTFNFHRCGPVTITPAAISFTAVKNGPLPTPLAINASNSGDLSCKVTCSEGSPWIHIKKAFNQPPVGGVPTDSSETWSVPKSGNKDFAVYALGTSGNAPGSPITCTNTTNGLGDATVTVSLTVNEPTLSVAPIVVPKIQCKKNGPCLPSETHFTVTNSGTGDLTFSVSSSSTHISTTITNGGALSPGEETDVVVTVTKNTPYAENVKLEFTNTTGIDNGNTARFLEVSVAEVGRLYALGSDGQFLGVGSNSYYVTALAPVLTSDNPVTPIENIIAVAAGRGHTLALDKNGNVWSWGDNAKGQLGRTGNTNFAAEISSLSNIIGIAAGSDHSLALSSDGHVYGWGYNLSGQLGNGTTQDSATPVLVLIGPSGNVPITNVARIDAGDKHSSFIQKNGVLYGAGYGPASINVSYNVTRAMVAFYAPTELSSIPIMTGSAFETTIILHDNNLLCNLAFNELPPCFNPNKSVSTIASGWLHYLFLSEGKVFKAPTFNWGNDIWSNPAEVVGLSDIARIEAGETFSVALSANALGGIKTWGESITGGAFSDVPTVLSGTEGATGLAAGARFVVILK